METLWKVRWEDGSELTSDDLIYRYIKDRLDELKSVSAIVDGKEYCLLWKERIFVLPDKNLAVKEILEIDNVRPICFRREAVDLAVGNKLGQRGKPVYLGLGLQGNTPEGQNRKGFILVDIVTGEYSIEVD